MLSDDQIYQTPYLRTNNILCLTATKKEAGVILLDLGHYPNTFDSVSLYTIALNCHIFTHIGS